jgi:hypothetical protein
MTSDENNEANESQNLTPPDSLSQWFSRFWGWLRQILNL